MCSTASTSTSSVEGIGIEEVGRDEHQALRAWHSLQEPHFRIGGISHGADHRLPMREKALNRVRADESIGAADENFLHRRSAHCLLQNMTWFKSDTADNCGV